jgi:hypothetical protein
MYILYTQHVIRNSFYHFMHGVKNDSNKFIKNFRIIIYLSNAGNIGILAINLNVVYELNE